VIPGIPMIEAGDEVRRRALSHGAEGAAWLAGLEGLVRDLAADWQLSIDRSLAGGTASLVLAARTGDGRDAVLKLAVPGLDPTASQLRVLLAARGRGYPAVLRHDVARGAVLLERLGPTLHSLGLPVGSQIEIICAALEEAWTVRPGGERFMTGAEKADALMVFIEETWAAVGRPCSVRVIDRAGAFARRRRAAFDPGQAVLAHADAHPWNTLLVPGEVPGRFKLIDPEGLLIERAYDVAILMREWEDALLMGDPVALGRARCAHLARRTSSPPEAIWEWAFLEHTATGLLLCQLGLEERARAFLRIAEAWAQV
jgi:streptomycin 6-kinase